MNKILLITLATGIGLGSVHMEAGQGQGKTAQTEAYIYPVTKASAGAALIVLSTLNFFRPFTGPSRRFATMNSLIGFIAGLDFISSGGEAIIHLRHKGSKKPLTNTELLFLKFFAPDAIGSQ